MQNINVTESFVFDHASITTFRIVRHVHMPSYLIDHVLQLSFRRILTDWPEIIQF
jgi:hypothetical protein